MTRPDFGAHLPDMIQLLEAARDAGVVTLMHCEDGALLSSAARRLEVLDQTSLDHYVASRPLGAEVAATQTAIALCEDTRAPVYIVHISCRRALDVCREGRRRYLPLYTETRPVYLHLTEERMQGPDPALYVSQPPLRSADDQQALWAGLADGTVDVLASDHAPWTREQKLDPSLSITRLRPGSSDLQFMLPMYFSEGCTSDACDWNGSSQQHPRTPLEFSGSSLARGPYVPERMPTS
jgi:dihydropyrimidinase